MTTPSTSTPETAAPPGLLGAICLVDDHGEFNLYLNDPARGAPRLMRANDGVHMTMAGYQRITAPLVGRIETYVAQSRLAAGLAPQMALAAPATPAQPALPAAGPAPAASDAAPTAAAAAS